MIEHLWAFRRSLVLGSVKPLDRINEAGLWSNSPCYGENLLT